MKLAVINAGNSSDLQKKYKIEGYPTLKHFNDGIVSNFKPRKHVELMVSELELFELPSFFQVESVKKFEEMYKSEEHPVAILVEGKLEDALVENFITLCNDHRTQPRSNYVVVSQEDKPASLTLYHKKDGLVKNYEGPSDTKSISAFIKEHSYRYIQDLNEYTFNQALSQLAPLFIIKVNSKEERNQTLQLL